MDHPGQQPVNGLKKAMDSLNAHYGRDTLAYAAAGRRKAWKLRRDFMSSGTRPARTSCCGYDHLFIIYWRTRLRRLTRVPHLIHTTAAWPCDALHRKKTKNWRALVKKKRIYRRIAMRRGTDAGRCLSQTTKLPSIF